MYNLSVSINDSNIGNVSGDISGSYLYEYEVTLVATAEEGYTFNGWYDGDVLISEDTNYNFDMPAYDLSLIAKFN